ncbi:MAG: hypothetical protein HY264_02015 [Chloroflexi bacterium]|nr:hypothetical protein [Chloroflexota bacterium]
MDIAPFAPCPDGPCTRVAGTTPCATAVLVRVGENDYVVFDLVGGP